MNIPGIVCSEGGEGQSLSMVFGEMDPTRISRPTICDKLIYVCFKSF